MQICWYLKVNSITKIGTRPHYTSPYSVALVMNSTSGQSSKINNLKIKIKDKENQNRINRETAAITNSSSTKHKSKTV